MNSIGRNPVTYFAVHTAGTGTGFRVSREVDWLEASWQEFQYRA